MAVSVIRVGLIQMRMGEDAAKNLAEAEARIAEAASKGANLVVLPELFLTPYFCQKEDPALFDLAEPIPGPTSQKLSVLAKKLGIVLVASLFEKRAPGLYHNTAVVLEKDGSSLGIYRKMHIPHDPLFYEKYYFTPGDLGFKSFDTSVGKVGVLICWDQWYPEAARATALTGAQILVYPTAIGWHPSEKAEFGESQREAWELAQRAHALANGVFVASVNRIGHEGDTSGTGKTGLEFWGNSFVSDPYARVLARASTSQTEVHVVDCDLSQIEYTRRNWPFLRDRRIEAYGNVSKRWAD